MRPSAVDKIAPRPLLLIAAGDDRLSAAGGLRLSVREGKGAYETGDLTRHRSHSPTSCALAVVQEQAREEAGRLSPRDAMVGTSFRSWGGTAVPQWHIARMHMTRREWTPAARISAVTTRRDPPFKELRARR